MVSRGERSTSGRPPVAGWSLRRRVQALLSVVVVVVLGAAIALSLTVISLRDIEDRQQHQLSPATTELGRALTLYTDEETGGRGYVITGNPAFLEPYRAASRTLSAVTRSLERQVAALPPLPKEIGQVSLAHDNWLRYGIGPAVAATAAGRLAQARATVATGRGKTLFDTLRSKVATAQASLSRMDAAATHDVRMLTNRLTILVIVSLVLLAAVVGVLWATLQRDVLAPLAAIGRYARAVADGELNRPVATTGPPEFRELGRDVEGMRRQLVAEIESARAAVEGLEQRGPAVAALRTALTPTLTAVPGLEVAGRLDPAEGVLAGDFYDTVDLGGGRLGLLLGDVSGHGPVPAVFALQLKELLVAGLEAGRSPGDALSWAAHHHLVDVPEDRFATVFIAVVDVGARMLSYANAGHPAGLIFADPLGPVPQPRRGERPRRTIRSGREVIELPATGPLLSPVVSTWSWSTLDQRFVPGDTLLTYTDGLVEARNDGGELFGLDRLLTALSGAGPDEPLEESMSQLFARVLEFSGGRAGDDTALLACRSVATAPEDVDGPLLAREENGRRR